MKARLSFLRTLESRRIERLGSGRQIDVDVRIVSATHRDIYKMAAEGAFREDFLYRINTIEIVLPPLRKKERGFGGFLFLILQINLQRKPEEQSAVLSRKQRSG